MASDGDVFISHSGKQKNFARQLHRDLTREHVSCFFDEDPNSLPLAEKFPSLIFKAAEKCKIAVVLLSKEFIHSKWPMQELSAFVKVMKSGKNVNFKLLPIFFMISPKELSHITKDNPEWRNLEVSDDTRGEWQEALNAVRAINGLLFGDNGDEVALRDKVVKKICGILRGIKPPMLLEFKPVGIEKQLRQVEALLDMKGTESVMAVIVYGFGGVGKSTLAASVVESLDWSSMDFKFCRVAIDEKTTDRTSHIIKLQKHILYILGAADVGFQDTLDGRRELKRALGNKSCLLLIDNVVDKDYIKDLLPQDLLFPSEPKTKLRIIITSRENNLKPELNITCKEYEVERLSDEVSRSLLWETIVQKSSKVEEFDEISMINEVAAKCRGVPLLLFVVGKHLKVDRNKDSYQEALDALSEGNLDSYRDEDLGATLMFVYNKIKNVEVKEAFLDICTYFHGWEWNLVVDIVDFRQLNELHRRALVSKSSSSEVIVHDILRFMGMKEASLTRFTNLDGSENVKDVKGISIVESNHLITIQSIQLEAMSQSLRVLMLGDWVSMEGPPCEKAFPNLRYLHVGDITNFPFKDLSMLDKLRVFGNRSKTGLNLSRLPSSLKRICHVVPHVDCKKFVKLPFQNLSLLKNFKVKTSNSVELPDELHLPSSLVDLDLNRCKNLPKDVGHLIALQSFILDRSDLGSLPRGFGELQRLKHLSLDYCSKLVFLSEELGRLSSLEALSMKGCKNLRALPESLGGLLSLQKLELDECINLHELPESLGELRIESLNLHSLANLNKLPNSFGKMPLLKKLRLNSCFSLISLPKSFVQLKMLETLTITKCTKLNLLPEDFSRLRCLKRMTVEECHLLKELPHDFGALPALKTFCLKRCNSFVNLPNGFTELTSLEELSLWSLPLMSRIPDGFGKLKKLRSLEVQFCAQLKIPSDDFENMATLERLCFVGCSELDGAVMEKIVRLPNCYEADIRASRKLLDKWERMKGETEHQIVVFSGEDQRRDVERAIRAALLNGKCMELNSANDEVVERSSLSVEMGLEEGKTATVALIMLPISMQSNEDQVLQRCVEKARERAESNGSGKLQIVCARKAHLQSERPTATEEKEEGIRQILLPLPKGSCVIPCSQSKRVNVLTKCCEEIDYCLSKQFTCLMANMGVDMKFTAWNIISLDVPSPPEMRKPENKHYNSIQNFIRSISSMPRNVDVGGEFTEALKGNGIHYLLTDNNKNQVMVDDLHGKPIGVIICHFKFMECIELQQIYKHLQQKDSDFTWIWIPTGSSQDCGHGTYTRLTQCMPWATFPHPQLVNVERKYPCFVVLDRHGRIANYDALLLLLAWGAESYPFTEHTIPESLSSVEAESCLEFLLQGMQIVGRKPMRRKMTFLHAAHPRGCLEDMSKLEDLTQIRGNFEVLYVGKSPPSYLKIEDAKEDYEDATQNMSWPSLSFSDMIMLWSRCRCLLLYDYKLCNGLPNIMMEPLQRLAQHLYLYRGLVLVDNDGDVVTGCGLDVVRMICESWDEEGMGMVKDDLILSLSRGECSPIVKTFFRDEIHNHPQHPQHPLNCRIYMLYGAEVCNMCGGGLNESRTYTCYECGWYMCGSCWKAYAKQQVEVPRPSKEKIKNCRANKRKRSNN